MRFPCAGKCWVFQYCSERVRPWPQGSGIGHWLLYKIRRSRGSGQAGGCQTRAPGRGHCRDMALKGKSSSEGNQISCCPGGGAAGSPPTGVGSAGQMWHGLADAWGNLTAGVGAGRVSNVPGAGHVSLAGLMAERGGACPTEQFSTGRG